MSYPDFPVIDRRDYRALIDVVRASQKNDYEMAAFALAVMVHATPWRAKGDRKVDLCFVHPATQFARGSFLFFLRDLDGELPDKKFCWVRFPTYLFTGDIASGLTYEALQSETSSLLGKVPEECFEAFKAHYRRGPIPAELIHPDGCVEVLKHNRKQFMPSDFETVLNAELAKQCIERFTTPYRFPF